MATNNKPSCNISVEVWKQILWDYCCSKKLNVTSESDINQIVLDALAQEQNRVDKIEHNLEIARKKLKFLEWISETGKAIGVLSTDEAPKS